MNDALPQLRPPERLLPTGMRAAFEFRDDSWRRNDVHEALDAAGAAWVLADRPGWRVPTIVTGGWSYVRFHQGQPARSAYTRTKLRAWADRLVRLSAADTYIFFNNDPMAAAPSDAERLSRLLERRGLDVATGDG